MDTQTFLKKLDRIQEIPTLPVVALKVNKMLEDYDTSIKALSNTIEKDQAVVSKILKLVNSAFYGFSSKISSIPHAITILGFNTVRNAVISVSVIDTFSAKDAFEGFNVTEFWKHSIAVAVTSRNIAEKTKLVCPDEVFVAGLLHDVGKVVMAQYFTELFAQVLEQTRENNLSFYQAEKKLLPANHAHIGAHLAKRWQLPGGLIEAIRYHHAVRSTVPKLNLLLTVHVSDFIVNNYCFESETDLDFSMTSPVARKVMDSTLSTVSSWYPIVATEIDSACEFFLEGEAK